MEDQEINDDHDDDIAGVLDATIARGEMLLKATDKSAAAKMKIARVANHRIFRAKVRESH